ncbi:unnamed protein product, partial [marine sediment metagenome]
CQTVEKRETRFTKDEVDDAIDMALEEFDGTLDKIADAIRAKLKRRPEIGPETVVTYEWRGNEYVAHFSRIYRPEDATNIQPHYPEDKVLTWAKAIFVRVWNGELSWDKALAELQAKMDAHKRGTP